MERQRSLYGIAVRMWTVVAQADLRCTQLHSLNSTDRDTAGRANKFLAKHNPTDALRTAPKHPAALALEKHLEANVGKGESSSRGGGRGGRRGRKRRFSGGSGSGHNAKKW